MANKTVNTPATIVDVNKALKSSEKVLRTEILRVEERVERVEERVERVEIKLTSMDAKLDKISNQLDGFVGRVDDLSNDNEIGTDHIHELRKTTKDHEKRIAKLESVN